MGVKELRPGMNLESVEWLRCIACGAPLRAESASPAENNGIVTEGKLICTSCGRVFPDRALDCEICSQRGIRPQLWIPVELLR